MEDNFLGSFFGRKFASVDCDFGIWWNFVGIGDPGEFLENAGAGLGIQAFAVALFADINPGRDVYQNE